MIQYPLHNHPTLRTLLLCALYAFLLLFFLSPDSYIRDIFGHFDTACFFMCGKAWMNGMIPYVDFTDSKGPLLWLIYGIGYLLNKHSFVGVFWISIIVYTIVFYLAYKISRLFLEPRAAALCVAALAEVMFFDLFHCEIRSEDFCFPFMMLSLYGLCRIILEKDMPRRTLFWFNFALGISFMACLLIKWNDGVMIGAPMLVSLGFAIKRKMSGTCIGGMLAGAIVLALPFLVYFLAFADFDAFIREYFVNTLLTMNGRTSALDALTFNLAMIEREKFTLVLLVGMLLFIWRHKFGVWLLLCFLFFRVCIGNCGWYYYTSLSPFGIFLFIAIVSFIVEKLPVLLRLTPLWCVLAGIFVMVTNQRVIKLVDQRYAPIRQESYQAAYVMAQIKKPKVFWYHAGNDCLGVPADALPACLYFVGQAGATEEMVKAREEALKSGVADFVIVHGMYPDELQERSDDVAAVGYVRYAIIQRVWGGTSVALYGRPGLKLPPPDFHVSQWDVWLKRNIFGI